MRVKPGQSLWIKLVNKMGKYSDAEMLGPPSPSAEDYYEMLLKPGEHIKYQRYKRIPDSAEGMKVDTPNMPKHFDSTNLHLHGLDVEVHMFDPVGTHDPDAPHIVIEPGQCYCYKFNIPVHHPTGMYWYHPHLHGSTAIQMWSGMMGVLYVDGPLEKELAGYGVNLQKEFVIWDPALRSVKPDPPAKHNAEVDEFLMGQTTLSKIHPFLINGKEEPHYDPIQVGQVLWLRVLCGTVENENTFIIYRKGQEEQPWEDVAVPFWVLAADGVTFPRPKKKNIMVLAGGQRQELLLQFDEPGTYVISQQGIQGMQFFDMLGHPHDQILATITVSEEESDPSLLPTVPISEMKFTPGYKEEQNIKPEDIVSSETIVFSMGANRDQTPFPQYYINGKSFAGDRIDFTAKPGEAKEYILMNAQHNVHPFHIHVNRFQIKEMGSELSTEKYPVLKSVLDFDEHEWRDIVVVPPSGRARIWVQYQNYTGKTVFHCHFLAHEDTGMMATLFIGYPKPRFVVVLWKEHKQLVLGLGGGVLAGMLLLWIISSSSRKQKRGYELAAMNEMKSKVTH